MLEKDIMSAESSRWLHGGPPTGNNPPDTAPGFPCVELIKSPAKSG